MADISAIAPIAARRSNSRWLKLPTFQIGASLAAISGLIGDAFGMAYVAPYLSAARRPEVVPDNDLEGRDPDW